MPTVHPLPVNPTTGQQPLASLRSVGATHSPSGVNREILKGLQDVAWSDEEVSVGGGGTRWGSALGTAAPSVPFLVSLL